MSRNSRSPKRHSNQEPEARDLWIRGARHVAEQGRLLWLLGEGLSAAMTAQAGGWAPDHETLLAELASWLQHSMSRTEPLRFEPRETCRESRPVKRQGTGRRLSGLFPMLDQEVLAETHCPVVWVGSQEVRGAWVSIALGAGVDGLKRVLALRAGSIRDAAVASELLDDLTTRGLRLEDGILVVTEGSRTLDGALARAWGERVVVAHCQRRVRYEVLAHAVQDARAALRSDLEAAWSMPADAAHERLLEVRKGLERKAPGAAERLARSLEPSLAVAGLGVASPLKEHLQSAGTLRMAFKKSLHWGGSGEAGLWALAAGLPVWLRRTRRLIGWRGLGFLAQALKVRAAANRP